MAQFQTTKDISDLVGFHEQLRTYVVNHIKDIARGITYAGFESILFPKPDPESIAESSRLNRWLARGDTPPNKFQTDQDHFNPIGLYPKRVDAISCIGLTKNASLILMTEPGMIVLQHYLLYQNEAEFTLDFLVQVAACIDECFLNEYTERLHQLHQLRQNGTDTFDLKNGFTPGNRYGID